MKKIVILIAALFVSVAASAQNIPQDSSQDSPRSFKVYCEIVTAYSAGLFTDRTTVNIDFGQQTDFWESDKELLDDSGRPIVFNNILDALNYMGERGWELVQEYFDISYKTDNPRHHWVLCKTVTDRSQITEGLLTTRMLKGQ